MIKVLCVEDDDLDRMIFKRAFKTSEHGVQLVFAHDVENARKHATDDFDCIFLDYSLPDGSGLDVLKYFRGQGNMSPIIMVTSQGDEKIAVEAMRHGALDYVPKNLLTTEGIGQSLRYAFRTKENELEKRRIERELYETQARLQTVVANSPIMLYCFDETGKYIFFEGRGLAKYGINPHNFIGKTIEEMAPHLPGVRDDFNEVMNGAEKNIVYETSGLFFQVFLAPMRDSNNKITGAIGVASDITNHKLAEKELIRAKQLAEEAALAKEQFLANMSHEIRTPMNGIIGITNILMTTNLEDEQKRFLESMKKCADNLMVIINDILDLSKIEAGKMTFENMEFNVEDVVKHTTTLYNPKALEKNISLNCDVDNAIPSMVCGDPNRLSQILNNLVSNALKFTEKGKVTIKATISANRAQEGKANHLHFEVSDTGIGIPEQSIATIFDSFTQASNDISRRFGGTGLGLSIVKKLVELQGGAVGVKSKIGEGTTFYFSIPLTNAAKGEKEKGRKGEEANQISSNVPSPQHTRVSDSSLLKHLNILIAEDNHINQMVVKKFLTDWGATVTFADNGAIAFEKASKANYDLILMDIHMPVMDGYTAVAKIRTELPAPNCNTPIIAMTASVPTEKDKCFELGMNGFIVKPFNPDDLKIVLLEYSRKKAESLKMSESKLNVSVSTAANNALATSSVEKQPTSIKIMENEHEMVKIDLVYLKQVSGNNTEFIMQMIEMFLKNTPVALEEMNEKFKQQNWEELRNIAHKIKSTYTYVGLSDVQKLLAEIEQYSTSKTNLEKLPHLMEEVESKSKEAFKALEEELDHMK